MHTLHSLSSQRSDVDSRMHVPDQPRFLRIPNEIKHLTHYPITVLKRMKFETIFF